MCLLLLWITSTSGRCLRGRMHARGTLFALLRWSHAHGTSAAPRCASFCGVTDSHILLPYILHFCMAFCASCLLSPGWTPRGTLEDDALAAVLRWRQNVQTRTEAAFIAAVRPLPLYATRTGWDAITLRALLAAPSPHCLFCAAFPLPAACLLFPPWTGSGTLLTTHLSAAPLPARVGARAAWRPAEDGCWPAKPLRGEGRCACRGAAATAPAAATRGSSFLSYIHLLLTTRLVRTHWNGSARTYLGMNRGRNGSGATACCGAALHAVLSRQRRLLCCGSDTCGSRYAEITTTTGMKPAATGLPLYLNR